MPDKPKRWEKGLTSIQLRKFQKLHRKVRLLEEKVSKLANALKKADSKINNIKRMVD